MTGAVGVNDSHQEQLGLVTERDSRPSVSLQNLEMKAFDTAVKVTRQCCGDVDTMHDLNRLEVLVDGENVEQGAILPLT